MYVTTTNLLAVGETFEAMISVSNTSDAPINGVRIIVEMHTNRKDAATVKEFTLKDVVHGSLASGALLTVMAKHTIDSLAPHALVCHIHHERQAPNHTHTLTKYVQNRSHRQYRFNVHSPPFVMRSEVHTRDAFAWHTDPCMRERTYVRIFIENVAQRPVRLNLLEFDSVDGWDASKIDMTSVVLMPKDTHIYVFVLTPRGLISPHTFRDALLQSESSHVAPCTHSLGHVRVAWHTPNADIGRLRIGPIQRTVPVPCAIQGIFTELYMEPHGAWRVDTPLSVTLHLHIWTLDPAMHGLTAHLLFVLDNSWKDILIAGPHQHVFSVTLSEHASFDIHYTMVPLQRGLISTGGAVLRRTDTQHPIRVWRRLAQFRTCSGSK